MSFAISAYLVLNKVIKKMHVIYSCAKSGIEKKNTENNNIYLLLLSLNSVIHQIRHL